MMDDEDCAGGECVGEQRNRLVSAREAIRHDARSDDRGHENGGAQRLRQQPQAKRWRSLRHPSAALG